MAEPRDASPDEAYAPSPTGWVRTQVEEIEDAGDTRAVHIQGRPVVMLTMRGARTGAIRKVPLMRVEHDGVYAAVASIGGGPKHPQWYHNLLAEPSVELMDGTDSWMTVAREIHGEEYEQWWARCVQAFPPYADYVVRAAEADRRIPVLLLQRV